ncbi:hypothetical protein LB545_07540 [Mesorhizobium sp. BR1-1-6]|uniref:hypothetical protein n=1 Tax=Mesorhizobium sp. BR1-1-6 TaxID=2876648 RepID=UPI001CD1795A|nr:hypothetical protein [Mesorhizobium sp. BR1-1-6]MBZ9894195.1 hypothetical protein [Mesorhizobium sp. BR1-1-6]
MTYDQWKTDSGYAEKTPEQENEGRDCPVCGGDCAGANPPVYHCPMKDGPLESSRAPQEQGVKVRELEWEETDERWWGAEPIYGLCYEIRITDRGDIRVRSPENGGWTKFDGSYDAAKSAAQADFEARILSALTIQEPASEPVANGVFRHGMMIGFVGLGDEFRLPEDTDERRPLYTHPPAPAVPADLVETKAQPATEVERKVTKALEKAWTDFCDANPDDLTSPEDLPNHALMTCAQFVDYASRALASLIEERDSWRRVAERLETEKQSAEAALAGALEALNPFAIPLGPSYQALDDREQFRTYFTLGNIRAAGRIIQSQRSEQ